MFDYFPSFQMCACNRKVCDMLLASILNFPRSAAFLLEPMPLRRWEILPSMPSYIGNADGLVNVI